MNWVEWIFFSVGVASCTFGLFIIAFAYLSKAFEIDEDERDE